MGLWIVKFSARFDNASPENDGNTVHSLINARNNSLIYSSLMMMIMMTNNNDIL